MDDDSIAFAALRKTWQPVALSRSLPCGGIASYRLLDQDLVIVRFADGVAAFPDACPHRGARFGIGAVVDGCLRCPYHGWSFDRTGQCRAIPSMAADAGVARGVRLRAFATRERYGFVWVRLDQAQLAELPDIPEFEDPAWTYLVAEPTPFGAGFRREIENYFDMSHFAFAHATTLGLAAQPFIDRYQVSESVDGLRMDADFPALAAATPGKLQQAHRRTQCCWLPNITTIRQQFADGDARVLVHVPSPNTATTCTVFWSIAISPGFRGPEPAQQLAFGVAVLDEDRRMCESQRPLEAPLRGDPGRSVPADRFALTFRKRLLEFCTAPDVAATATA